MSQHVDAIMQQIECLDEADRLALEHRLQELSESEWKQEVEHARDIACQQGIDQGTIDDAVEKLPLMRRNTTSG